LKITDDNWNKFTNQTEQEIVKDIEDINLSSLRMNINILWNKIREVFKNASKELPKKKLNPIKEILPEKLIFLKKANYVLSKILLYLTIKKIKRDQL
jgi:hypothetical protein